jgi:hypothetical protein
MEPAVTLMARIRVNRRCAGKRDDGRFDHVVEDGSAKLKGEFLIELVGDQFNACREGVISSRIGQ